MATGASRSLHLLPPGRPKADNGRDSIAPDGQLALGIGGECPFPGLPDSFSCCVSWFGCRPLPSRLNTSGITSPARVACAVLPVRWSWCQANRPCSPRWPMWSAGSPRRLSMRRRRACCFPPLPLALPPRSGLLRSPRHRSPASKDRLLRRSTRAARRIRTEGAATYSPRQAVAPSLFLAARFSSLGALGRNPLPEWRM